MTVAPELEDHVTQEDHLRAQGWRLLARVLAKPPLPKELDLLAGLSGDESELGRAFSNLARIAASSTSASVAEEYQDLFVGVGRGELVPFASYYLTGFLNEKPLARLRNDMRRIGAARREGVSEPEDHIASLCEIMAGLIAGEFGEPADLEAQKAFFETHIAPWARHFFEDLEGARASVFYAAAGALGKAFIDVEVQGFRMIGA